jgi:hypothetical protein
MATPGKLLPRRALIRGALAGMAGGWALDPARAQPKMSREAAQYRDTPKGVQMCATCTLFLPPSACKSVEGEIAADGWCKLFDMVD